MRLFLVVLTLSSIIASTDDSEARAGAGYATTPPRPEIKSHLNTRTLRSPVKSYEEQYSGQSRWGASSYYLSDKDCDKLMEEFRQIKEKRGK